MLHRINLEEKDIDKKFEMKTLPYHNSFSSLMVKASFMKDKLL